MNRIRDFIRIETLSQVFEDRDKMLAMRRNTLKRLSKQAAKNLKKSRIRYAN
jgi:hypothetical protein